VISIRPYKKRRSFFVPGILLLLAGLLLWISPNILRTSLSIAVWPLQTVGSFVWCRAAEMPSSLFKLSSALQENAQLRAELRLLKAKSKVYDGLSSENSRLRSEMGFRQSRPYALNLIVCQVISRSPSPWFTVLSLNRGSNSGVKVGSAVIYREGLVGRVVETTPISSKVMLILDANSSIAAVNSKSRDFGVVEGGVQNKLFMRYVQSGASIAVGDTITTSNLSTLFPSGIPIGTVTKIMKSEQSLFYRIEIKPAVSFSKLEEVFVVI